MKEANMRGDFDFTTVIVPSTTQLKQEPALRYDAGKPRWDLLPPEFEEVVKVYTMGAQKYADRNWEKGMSWGRIFRSLISHTWKFYMKGETNDEESGLHHMAHATWNAIALMTYSMRKVGTDDRSLST